MKSIVETIVHSDAKDGQICVRRLGGFQSPKVVGLEIMREKGLG